MWLLEEHRRQLEEMIKNCVDQLYNNDMDLIARGGMEQSILFRFALYLNDYRKEIEWLKDFQLDVEYNKNGVSSKRLPRRPNGVRPDLIIHSRGNNDANILVIEIKGWWNYEPREDDIIKLEDFTHQDGEYKYGLGVFLDFGKTNCKLEYFINGEKANACR